MKSNLLRLKQLCSTLLLTIPFTLFSQDYFVDFEEATSSSSFTTNYGSQTGDLNNLEWQLGPEVLIGDLANDQINGDRAARLRGRDGAIMTMLEDKMGGMGTVSFLYKQYGTDADQQPWRVEYSTDGGGTWTQLGSDFVGNATIQTFSEEVDSPDNGRIRIVIASTPGETGNRRLNIDDILITDFGSVPAADTTVTIASNNQTVSENAGTINVNLTLNQAVQVDKTVDFVLTSGNNALVDGFTFETVTFTAGGSTTQSVSLNISSGVVSGSETLTFELQNPSAGLDLGTNTEFELVVQELASVPFYDIATVRGANLDGAPDSLGVECRLSGTVIGINFTMDPGLNFFINDGTAGINVFAPVSANNNFGYDVSEGDSIEIQGTIAAFRGQAQIEFLTDLQVVGIGTVPQPQIVTELNEDTEGELVTLENLTVVNQNQWTQTAGGFSLFAYNATDIFEIRVDSRTDVFNMSIPGCEFSVTGIGTQRASTTTAPFNDGYRIFPRSAADFDVTAPCPESTTPVYTIGEVNGVDANGVLDSLGVECILRGTVYGCNLRSNGLEFTIHDGTGGIGVFASAGSNTFGYTVNEGDSIEVHGELTQFRGLAQMGFLDTLFVLGTGSLKTPTVVSALNQATESELVTLQGVTLVNVSSWPSAGSGATNVDINLSSGGTTTLRIYPCTGIAGTPAPTGSFNVTGIGSQFNSTTTPPFNNGYRLVPRSVDDFSEGTSVDFPLYPIIDVRGTNTDGVLDSLGISCKLRGTVLGVNLRNGGLEFTIHDGTAGIGVFAPAGANTFGYTVTEGDSIEVQGEIAQFRGLAQIAFLQSLNVLGTGVIPTPTVVTSLGEDTESELVKLEDVSLTDVSAWPAPGANAANVSVNMPAGGTEDLRIFPQTGIATDLSAPTGEFNVIGIGNQFSSSTTPPFNDGYRLIPRKAADFELTTSISNTLKLVGFTAYPNPVADILKLEFDYTANEAALVQIYDVTGKLIINSGTLLNSGYNQINLSTERMNAGYYFVRVVSDNGTYTTNIIKE